MAIVSRRVALDSEPIDRARSVEFVRLDDGRWSTDALFAVRYGGETVYRRALVLAELPIGTAVVASSAFPPFRDAAPELLGWARRVGSSLPGVEISGSAANNDRDAVRFARLLYAHGAPAAPYEYDDGPARLVSAGSRCVLCGADTARSGATLKRRRRAETTATLVDWLPEAERDPRSLVVGWHCSPCGAVDACRCPACPDCEETPTSAAESRCSGCSRACPPYFAPASERSRGGFAPIEGVYLHGSLERRIGGDRLLAIDGASLADRLLDGATRVESEAYLLFDGGQVETIAVLWRRGPSEVRGLVVDSSDEESIAYAEQRAAELSDIL